MRRGTESALGSYFTATLDRGQTFNFKELQSFWDEIKNSG